MSHLFAQITPLLGAETSSNVWTNREVVELLLKTVIPALITGAGVMWGILHAIHRKRGDELEKDRRALLEDKQALQTEKLGLLHERTDLAARLRDAEGELNRLRDERMPRKAEYEEVRKRLGEVEGHAKELEHALAGKETTAAEKEELARHLQAGVEGLRRDLDDYDRKLRGTTNRVRRALQLEGLLWEDTVYHDAPAFRPLGQRATPIVSVLNLKGGVGKTTLTANLGAAFAAKGYRVLMIDLDLQGSLTGLFLPDERQQELYHGRRLVQDFLNGASEDVTTNLLDYIQPALGDKSGLVATADTLAYTELNLTFKWLLRLGKRDPRFLLRKALHLKRVTGRYDLILLDCPPLMNVSCVNAMAASDYILVPVMPSRQATNRVPPLLKMLKSFRENINPALNVLGVVANRTLRAEMTTDEANRWNALRDQCRDQWGEPVHMFETVVRQNTEIREVEDERRTIGPTDEMYPVFRRLAEEVEERLPGPCLAAARREAAKEAGL